MAFKWLSDEDRGKLELARKIFAAYPETAYSAIGREPVPPSVYRETGSERENKFPDVVPQLASRINAIKIYDQMVNNDATVDVSIRTAKTSINGASFFIEPYSESQDDQDMAEFVEYNTLCGTNEPFAQTREKILRMYDYGISCFEPVYIDAYWAPKREGANARKFTMLKKLAYRPASTLLDFKYDENGGPAGVVQNAVRGDNTNERVELDMENLVIFAFDSNGGPFNGKSLIRKAYKHWFYKDYFYKILAVQIERHSIGFPHVKLMPGFTQKEIDAAWRLVNNARANEDSGVVTPPGIEFEFAALNHTPVNIIPAIEHHDSHILLNTLTQFLIMGLQTGGSGGRSTGATGADMLQKANRFIADYICDVYNMFVIPKLIGYNFKTANYPKMRVKRLGETKDLQMWASAFANLAAGGLITPDHDLEEFIREELDAPYISEIDRQKILDNAAKNIADAKANNNGKGDVAIKNRNSGTGNKNTVPGYEGTA